MHSHVKYKVKISQQISRKYKKIHQFGKVVQGGVVVNRYSNATGWKRLQWTAGEPSLATVTEAFPRAATGDFGCPQWKEVIDV